MRAADFLAFDLGAESGRAVRARLADGRLAIRELRRFPNGIHAVNGRCHWDVVRLFAEIKESLRVAARQAETPPASMGIDTWGVDFALLGRDGNLLALPFSYRDPHTTGAMESFFRKVPRERVYELTGIQFLPLNSLFQLEAMVRDASPLLPDARDLLFIPDLFHYWLTGVKKTEFTFATTSQLFNPRAMAWEEELLAALRLPRSLFQNIVMPGTVLAPLNADVARETGFPRVPLVAVATHDTGSAVAATPGEGDDWAYISSGTWSLVGVESPAPILTPESRDANFTNEGGVGGTFRVLKNVAGLWLLQQCRRAWAAEQAIGYDDLTAWATQAAPFAALIDPDDASFLNPPDMPAAIAAYCARTGQRVPETKGATVRAILDSLALKYRWVLEQLQRIQPRPIRRLHVIGGGARNRLLCQFTADATGLPVFAGPVEATAIGNLLVQAMAGGALASLSDARQVVRQSFALERYEPREPEEWDAAWQRFRCLVAGEEVFSPGTN
jgi:rhamnulokinase